MMDSDEEWLHEICRAPNIGNLPVMDPGSEEEFLQELLTSPPGAMPLTLLASGPDPAPTPPSRRRGSPTAAGRLGGGGAPSRRRDAPTAEGRLGGGGTPSRRRGAQAAEGRPGGGSGFGGAQPAASAGSDGSHETLMDIALSLGHLPNIDMPGQDDILWSISPGDVDRAYTHALRRFLAWRELLDVMIFKVGIASDPVDRYHNAEHGYQHESVWLGMDVVWRGPAYDCRTLEMRLIESLRSQPGCYNERRGGDGVAPHRDHTCYCYFVIAPAGHGVGLRRAHAARASSSPD